MSSKQIRVNKKDADMLMKECKELYLKFHPDMKNEKISNSFMLRRVIEFYLKT
jgi:hypothetical protein